MTESYDTDILSPPTHSQDFLDDPAPVYERMRERREVLYFPGMAATTSYAAFEELMQKSEVFTPLSIPAMLGLDRPMIPLHQSGEDHVKYRKLLSPLFAPRRVDFMEAGIRETVSDLLAQLRPKGSCNFTTEFAVPLPCAMFLNMFSAPPADLDKLIDLNDRWVRAKGETIEEQGAERALAVRDLYHWLDAHLDAHDPDAEDLLSELIAAEVDGERLSREELLDISFNLLIGTLDTVMSTLTCAFAMLARDQPLRTRLAADPALVPDFVEEVLRRECPVLYVYRVAAQAGEIAGCPISAGTLVAGYLGAANTDPAQFDDPLAFQLERPDSRHFAFGAGVHRCLGSHLARRELRVAIEAWHAAIPDYRIADSSSVHFTDGIRAVPNLMLEFEASE